MSWRCTCTSAVKQALALVLLVLALAAPAAAQNVLQRLVSPGPLASVHARAEPQCDSCHASFDKTAQSRLCASCHRPVTNDIAARTGFHGRNQAAATRQCRDCHTDHKGRAARIVRFDQAAFNHAETDFALAGRHAGVACGRCHAQGRKFRDAPAGCIDCHAEKDPHRGQLRNCQSCHNAADWKQVRFDHSTTRYPLRGAHERVSCNACHANQRFRGISTACVDCHRNDDAHRGSLGARCESCHNETAWRTTRFDHDTTRFPLRGEHTRAACAACHRNGVYKGAPTACIDCHRSDDRHNGSLGPDCAACHSPQAWRTVRFDHARTGFPLLGKHGPLACNACHVEPADRVHLSHECVACHARDDSHHGVNGPRCADCHNAADWKRTSFDHAARTRFPLLGAHAPLACTACHVRPAAEVKLDMRCVACHAAKDVHAGQEGADCAACHGVRAWNQDVRFDHGLTSFPLVGHHQGPACTDCHQSKRFKDADAECVACHRDDDRHEGRLGPNCGACHAPTAWANWTFDHDHATRFPLTGKHAGLVCESCHTERNVRRVRQSGACIECHARDDAHQGEFGVDCGRCHTTETFRGGLKMRLQ